MSNLAILLNMKMHELACCLNICQAGTQSSDSHKLHVYLSIEMLF